MRRAAFFVAVALAAWSLEGISWGLDALGSPVPGAVLVRFGERYGSDRPRTHCGLDLAGTPGEPVRAPCDGEVVFAGLIPADGGGRTGAVTIQPEDGVAVTVFPLAEVAVTRGDAVDRGAIVGALAAAGDGSSAEPHLHVSVRREGRYVDPEPLLEPNGPVHGDEPEQAGVELEPEPPASVGQHPETVDGANMPAGSAGPCAQAVGGIATRKAAPSTCGATGPRASTCSSAAGADAYGVRAAYWRATTARRSIRAASGGSLAVGQETPRVALPALRSGGVPVSGVAAAAGAAAACAAASARRRAALVRA